MKQFLFSNSPADPIQSLALLTLRVGTGLMMLLGHGWTKFQSFDNMKESFPIPKIWILESWMNHTTSLAATIFAEVVCSALIVIGLATRPAAAVLAFTMSIAAFVVLREAPYEKKELAIFYLLAAVVLLISGAGRYAIDARFSQEKKRTFR
jgi:putative oxidoreductase